MNTPKKSVVIFIATSVVISAGALMPLLASAHGGIPYPVIYPNAYPITTPIITSNNGPMYNYPRLMQNQFARPVRPYR